MKKSYYTINDIRGYSGISLKNIEKCFQDKYINKNKTFKTIDFNKIMEPNCFKLSNNCWRK